MKNIFTLTIVLLLTFSATMFSQEKKRQLSRTYIDALSYADVKNYKQAITLFKRVLKTEPNSPEVNYYLGYCYLNTPEGPDSALIYFEKGLKNLPENDYDSQLGVDLRYLKGKSHQLTLNPDEAVKEYRQLLSIVPVTAVDFRAQIERDIVTCSNLADALKKPVMMESLNAGKIINSKFDDHSPLPSTDGSTLFFTTRRTSSYAQLMPDGQYSEKIYVTTRNENNGEWSKPVIINKLFKREGHESGVSISVDGSELYLFRNDIDGKNLYRCIFDGKNWSEPVKLPKPINSEYNETHLTLSPDKSVAYFTSDRPGGIGGLDIYQVRRLPDGTWAKPVNMGTGINTPFDEETPMLHPDGKTLYFSSEGHNSIGGLDIFTVKQQPDSTWSDVINLGYPVNTPDDDFFFVPTATYNQAWYSSARFRDTHGGHDLYLIQYEESEESKLAVLKGEISSSEDNSLETIKITLKDLSSGEVVGEFKPHPVTGRYILLAEWGKNYDIEYTGNEYYPVVKNLSVTLAMTYAKSQKSYPLEHVQLVAVERPKPEVTEVIAAATDKSAPVARSNKSTRREMPQTGDVPVYTVQILTRKGPVESWERAFKGLDLDQIIEYVCKNNVYRYAYGEYKGYKAAVKAKEKVLEATPFSDSFIRDVKQYQELLETK